MASELRSAAESPGDVLVSREELRRAAMSATGGMQAIVGFLQERDDLSREWLADKLEEVWRELNAKAEATPSMYGPQGREGGSDA